MKKLETAALLIFSTLLFGCVAQEADLRQTERALQQRIKEQDDQLAQLRARQGHEITTLRDQELPRLRGELERAQYLTQDLQAKQEDFKHLLAQLEQHVKTIEADNTARHAWVAKSIETQEGKVTTRIDELTRMMETAMALIKKDLVDAIQRTNEMLAKRVDARLEEQQRKTAEHHQRLDQVSEKFVQFNQALTGFRDSLAELHDRVEQGEQAAGKALESIQQVTVRLEEQDRRMDSLVKLVEAVNRRASSHQPGVKSAQRSDNPSITDSEPGQPDRSRSEAGAALGTSNDRPESLPETTMNVVPPKEFPASDLVTGKAELSPDRAQYERVLARFRKGDFEGAREGFKAFLAEYPNSDLAPNAQYWQGEAYYGGKEYQKAIEAYDRVELHYPHSEKVPAAILKKGYAYLALKDKKRASSAFKQVITLYPKSPEASKASDKLAQLKKVQ